MAIYVKEDGLVVRAPLRVPVRVIDDFVTSKQPWIEKQLERQKSRKEKRANFDFGCGTTVFFTGHEFRVDAIINSAEVIGSEMLRNKLIEFYKAQAQGMIEKRVNYFSERMGVHPSSIKIGCAKRSWASCSASGRLIFSWRLMMAPPDAIDYVVVHELAHLKHLNHSNSFWGVVTRIMPDWKERRKKLRLLHKRLSDEVWD